MSYTAKPKLLIFPLYDGVQLLDVSGPAEVFSEANRESGGCVYDIRYVSTSSTGTIRSSAGLGLATRRLPRDLEDLHTLAIPGGVTAAIEGAASDAKLMAWLRRATLKAERIASICSGAFLLGPLGVLDGRVVTTHWMALDRLQQEFPDCEVAKDTLYTRDGNLWTSAGVLSGVDMALAIVAHDLNATVALKIARNLVIHLIREGGQSQFSGPIDFQTKAARSDLLGLVAWLCERVNESVTVEQMAKHMRISVRTLHRRCLQVFERTPAQLLSELRLEQSRNLLHNRSLAVKMIAHECGFSNSSSFSKAFTHRFGVSPLRYRQRFQNQP